MYFFYKTILDEVISIFESNTKNIRLKCEALLGLKFMNKNTNILVKVDWLDSSDNELKSVVNKSGNNSELVIADLYLTDSDGTHNILKV